MFLIPITEYITTLYLSNITREILPTAYVLVLLDYHYPDYEIMSQLSKLACVTEVNRVDGPYDIIVKLSDNNMDTIKESIGKYMTRINGIQSTLTLMAE
jgi:DNA-binding Lrp family transcriptional regulator